MRPRPPLGLGTGRREVMSFGPISKTDMDVASRGIRKGSAPAQPSHSGYSGTSLSTIASVAPPDYKNGKRFCRRLRPCWKQIHWGCQQKNNLLEFSFDFLHRSFFERQTYWVQVNKAAQLVGRWTALLWSRRGTSVCCRVGRAQSTNTDNHICVSGGGTYEDRANDATSPVPTTRQMEHQRQCRQPVQQATPETRLCKDHLWQHPWTQPRVRGLKWWWSHS